MGGLYLAVARGFAWVATFPTNAGHPAARLTWLLFAAPQANATRPAASEIMNIPTRSVGESGWIATNRLPGAS